MLKELRRTTNREYQKIANTNRITAFRDLSYLVDIGLIEMVGGGRGTYYKMKRELTKSVASVDTNSPQDFNELFQLSLDDLSK